MKDNQTEAASQTSAGIIFRLLEKILPLTPNELSTLLMMFARQFFFEFAHAFRQIDRIAQVHAQTEHGPRCPQATSSLSSSAEMAELYQTSKQNISLHIQNVLDDK